MFKMLLQAFNEWKFRPAKHGAIRYYKGEAYVYRHKSQYCGWYSATSGKKLPDLKTGKSPLGNKVVLQVN